MEVHRSLSEIDERIAVIRSNIDELIEQAAAYSGAVDEDRNAERIAEQQDLLDALIREREARVAEGDAGG